MGRYGGAPRPAAAAGPAAGARTPNQLLDRTADTVTVTIATAMVTVTGVTETVSAARPVPGVTVIRVSDS